MITMNNNQIQIGATLKINLGQSCSVAGTISEITTNKWGKWVGFTTIHGNTEFFKFADFITRILS